MCPCGSAAAVPMPCFCFDFAIACDCFCDEGIPAELKLNGSVAEVGGEAPVLIDDLIVFGRNVNDAGINELRKYYEENPRKNS